MYYVFEIIIKVGLLMHIHDTRYYEVFIFNFGEKKYSNVNKFNDNFVKSKGKVYW